MGYKIIFDYKQIFSEKKKNKMYKKLVLLAVLFFLINTTFNVNSQILLPDTVSGLNEYQYDKTCNYYRVNSPLTANAHKNQKIKLIDMKGKVVKTFYIFGMPAKLFPGGYVLGRDGWLSWNRYDCFYTGIIKVFL